MRTRPKPGSGGATKLGLRHNDGGAVGIRGVDFGQ